MKHGFFTRTIGALMIVVFFSACTTMMTVNAVDPTGSQINGATVLVDGENIGQTPAATTTVSNFVGSTTELRVTANGYHPRTLEASREVKMMPLVVGIFVWPLLLWVWGPTGQQNVVLTPAR
ncbi:MAG: PEGA domain-containing protein [Treponema sp.]|nr:PEGA domain-containing protein [Treponema sp.]